MKSTERDTGDFEITDKFKKRALELLDESHALQFAEGLRLNSAMATVFARERKRLEAKYGPDDSRSQEMTARVDASAEAKLELFSRFSDAMTPPTTAQDGWAVDGFVRAPTGAPVEGLTVAAFDKDANVYKEFGRAVTDAKGFFSLKVDKFPDNPPSHVFMRAMKGRTPLESKEVRLVPVAGSSERVEIILTDRSNEKPETPSGPDKSTVPDKPVQPDKSSVPVPDKPVQPDKSSVPVPDKPVQPDKSSVPVPEKPAEPTRPPVVLTSRPAVAITRPKTTKRTAKAKPKAATKKTSPAKSPGKPRAKTTKRKK
jgi:hypothetical protein